MSKAKVVHIIDDDPAVRDSVQGLVTAEGYTARTYVSAQDFLESIDTIEIGCVVTDVRMPGLSGIDLLSKVSERGLPLPVIVITAHADVPLAVDAMKQGAADLIQKPFRAEVLMSSIKQALADRNSASNDDASAHDAASRLASLSARESEVLSRLIRGQPNKVIAHEMGISPRTVEVHRASVMKKTEAKSLSELVRMSLLAARR